MPDQVYSVQWNGSEKLGFAYDNLGRLAQKNFGGNSFGIKYAYENYEIAKAEGAAEKRTTTLVKSVETPAGTYSYEYDKLGNIISVANGTTTVSYEYDSLNQLTRVNDEKAGKTITYSYTNGNITEQKEYEYTTGELGEPTDTKTWSYTDSVWSDLLTDFNGTQIAYDEIGNPLSIGSKQLTWLGRQLQSIADGENTIEYAYNGDGNRISKTVNGVKTEFVYNGDILAGQKSGNDTLVFIYDNNSDIFGFILNGTEYYYIKNAQNDVTAIADKDGNVLVNYAYDSWGKVMEITGNTALAEQNPIRYRSYYFDFETEWYFLSSRYYNAEACRFVNSDNYALPTSTPTDITDKNLYSYCDNNPIVRADVDGDFWHIVIGAAVGGAVAATTTALSGGSGKEILISAVSGALSGGLACSGLGKAALVVANVVISAAESFATQAVNKGVKNVSAKELFVDAAIGGFSGIGGGNGNKHLNTYGRKAAKRVINKFANRGFRSGLKEAKKAGKYYFKSNKKYYINFMRDLAKDLGKSMFSIIINRRKK